MFYIKYEPIAVWNLQNIFSVMLHHLRTWTPLLAICSNLLYLEQLVWHHEISKCMYNIVIITHSTATFGKGRGKGEPGKYHWHGKLKNINTSFSKAKPLTSIKYDEVLSYIFILKGAVNILHVMLKMSNYSLHNYINCLWSVGYFFYKWTAE